MKSKTKVMLLSVVMAAVFGVCNLGGVARLSFVSKAEVKEVVIKKDGAVVTETEISCATGDKFTIDAVAIVTESESTEASITVSSGTDIVSIDSEKNLKCLQQGVAVLRATSTENSAVTKDLTIKVNDVAVNSVSLDPASANIEVGKSVTLTPSFDPATATNKNLTWTSDKPSVAEVVDGIVTGKSEGTAVITATPTGGGTAGNATITVTAAVVKPTEITPASLPSGTKGVPYDQTLQTNGTSTITWTITSGDLPNGLSLGPSDGKITGSPTTSGTFDFTVEASNSAGKASRSYTITIGDAATTAPIVTTAALPDGSAGTAYSTALAASGGGVMTWSLKTGDKLPDGLSLASTGVISGTPTKEGTYSFTVIASNGITPSGEKQLSIKVTATVTAITVTPSPAKVTVTDTLTLTAVTTPAGVKPTWTSDNEAVATVDANGVVKGVTAGKANITANAGGKTATVVVTVAAAGDPVIKTTSPLKSAVTGTAYSEKLTASGLETGKQKWTIASGSGSKTTAAVLKDTYGLTLATDGTLSGTPKLASASTGLPITIRVESTDNASLYDEREFALVITDSAISGSTALLSGTADGNPVTDVTSNINEYAAANSSTLAESGKFVQVELVPSKIAADKVPSKRDIDNLTKVAFHGYADNEITIAYLNMDVFKRVKNTTGESFPTSGTGVSKITDTITPIEIGLKMDSTRLGKRPVITRIHGDQTKNFISIGSRPTASRDYVDGTYYIDANNGILYLYSRYFSVYTIAYAENAHLVTFNLDGGSGVPEQLLVKHGATLADLTEPTKNGYNFDGWFREAALTNLWNDTDAVNGDMALFASWTTGQSSNRAPRSNTNTDGATETDERSVRGSRTGDNKEAERIARLLAIMTTTWIVLFNALAFGKKRRQRIRRK